MKIEKIESMVVDSIRPKNVCAYVRVSSPSPSQGNSLANQEAYFKRLYGKDKNCRFVGVFSDFGFTGTNGKRPAFRKMLQMCREGKIDLIHTKSVSRFSRSLILMLSTIRELKSLGVGVYFEEQGIDTLTERGEIMLTVLAKLAEEEAGSISTNQKWSYKKRFAEGKGFVNTERFMGYDRDSNGRLVINKDEAAVVRRIFSLYLQGYGISRIVKVFNAIGIPTLTGKKWKASTISSMLQNEKYKGDFLMQKYYTPKVGASTVLNKGQEKSFYINSDHEPIISPSDWEKVQVIRKAHRQRAGITEDVRKKYSVRHPLSGKLKCPYCGKTLFHHHAYKSYQWVCSNYIVNGKDACQGIRVPEEAVKDWKIDEPVIVLEEVNVDGKKYYSHTSQYADGTKAYSYTGKKDTYGRILPRIHRTRRTAIKL